MFGKWMRNLAIVLLGPLLGFLLPFVFFMAYMQICYASYEKDTTHQASNSPPANSAREVKAAESTPQFTKAPSLSQTEGVDSVTEFTLAGQPNVQDMEEYPDVGATGCNVTLYMAVACTMIGPAIGLVGSVAYLANRTPIDSQNQRGPELLDDASI